MARAKVDPDAEIAALHEKRLGLAVRRDAHVAAQGAAERMVQGSADRRSAALVADARGETGAETAEQVDRDRYAAEAAIRENRERAEALKQVEQEVQEDVERVIDAHPAHFVEKAGAASKAASEAIAAATQATQAAASAWQEARAAWSVVRMSYRRRGLEMPPEMPISDLGTAVNELAKSQSRPFPGGSRQNWERFSEREKAGGVSGTGRASATTSGPASEPLMERLG